MPIPGKPSDKDDFKELDEVEQIVGSAKIQSNGEQTYANHPCAEMFQQIDRMMDGDHTTFPAQVMCLEWGMDIIQKINEVPDMDPAFFSKVFYSMLINTDVMDEERQRLDIERLVETWMTQRLMSRWKKIVNIYKTLRGVPATVYQPLNLNDHTLYAMITKDIEDENQVFVIQHSGSHCMLVMFSDSKNYQHIHVRDVNESASSSSNLNPELLCIDQYQYPCWEPEFGDCRDVGYILSYQTAAESINGCFLAFFEMNMFMHHIDAIYREMFSAP